MTTKTYSELVQIPKFEDRIAYLMTSSVIGEETFGSKRYINQVLYQSLKWKRTRRRVILRDDGFDLAHEDYPIDGNVIIHHINPITIEDILNEDLKVYSLENLISCSDKTHKCIHYSNKYLLKEFEFTERSKYDTCPWRISK